MDLADFFSFPTFQAESLVVSLLSIAFGCCQNGRRNAFEGDKLVIDFTTCHKVASTFVAEHAEHSGAVLLSTLVL